MNGTDSCPCGSDAGYSVCCGPYHTQAAAAPTAEALMRARYCAYVLNIARYIRLTWDPQTCPTTLNMDAEPRPQWIGLELKSHRVVDSNSATVEFIARYKLNGRAYRLHEISLFEQNNGRWLYVGGVNPE